jgi:magnesium chelatase family protein
MHVRIHSADIAGIDAFSVEIEVDIGGGLPGYHLVGLAATAVSEGRVRVRSALINSGFELPARKITVNLAPAEVRKDTAAFDLAVALAVLGGLGIVDPTRFERVMVVGELALDGTLRPVEGVLPVAALAHKNNFRTLIVPQGNGAEGALVQGLDVREAVNLNQVVSFFRGQEELAKCETAVGQARRFQGRPPDLCDVRGQKAAKRALEVAAAGGHNLLMVGPPGSGKSMLAHRLAGLLPAMTFAEALESTRIYSVCGLLERGRLLPERPFRAPHHTISTVGLVGGGTPPQPGELSLAHNGVLFLDEVLEFRRSCLEALRQPLETKVIHITRSKHRVSFPADVMLVMALNPCPCGHLGDPGRTCICSDRQIANYRNRLSGPLVDRVDLHIEMTRPSYTQLTETQTGEHSERVRQRVEHARARQMRRLEAENRHRPLARWIRCNAQMEAHQLEKHCRLETPAENLLQRAAERLGLSARAVHKVLKVAQTIADLDQAETIASAHVAEAVRYRSLDWLHQGGKREQWPPCQSRSDRGRAV